MKKGLTTTVTIVTVVGFYVCFIHGNSRLREMRGTLPVQGWRMLPVPEHFVCQSFEGRLANHIWQYASIYGIAKRNNLTIILGRDDDLVKYFEVPSARILPSRSVCDTFHVVTEKYCCSFDSTLMRLEQDRNYKIGNFLQSWRYFDHVVDEVLQELTFKRPIRERAHNITTEYREKYKRRHGVLPVVVGVHVRVGDIATDFSLKEAGITDPADSFYHRGMELFSDRYKHVIFILCTDTIERGRRLIGDSNLTIHMVHNSPILDMAVMASCDHAVTSLFSFSWWSGFLSRGTVVYFGSPVTDDGPARKSYNYSDYFPPPWKSLV